MLKELISIGQRTVSFKRRFLYVLLFNCVMWIVLRHQMLFLDGNGNGSADEYQNDSPLGRSVLQEEMRSDDDDDDDDNYSNDTLAAAPADVAAAGGNPFEGIMLARRQRIEGVCKSNNGSDGRNAPNYWELYLQREWRMVWCPAFKAASTTWLTYFVQLSPQSKLEKERLRRLHKGRINEVARDLYPRISTENELVRFKSAISSSPSTSSGGSPPPATNSIANFLVVRHPFSRLVSAYRDKLERSLTHYPMNDYFYKLYGGKIFSKYRERAVKKFGEEFFSAEKNFGAPLPLRNGGSRKVVNPTFWEFIQFVRDTKSPVEMDVHWQPISTFCSVCSFHFDYILKFENITKEEGDFMEARRLNTVLTRSWMNPNSPEELRVDPDALTKIYFEQLDDDDVSALYRIYENDFKMFDYTFAYRNHSFPM